VKRPVCLRGTTRPTHNYKSTNKFSYPGNYLMIIRNTIYNLLGLGLPLIVAIFTIPILLDSLGYARFGVLTLVWALVSYVSLLDMGLGRALTFELSVINKKRKFWRIPKIIGTTYILMSIIGFVLCVAVFIFAEPLANLIKDLDDYEEVIDTLYIMSITIPFVIISSGSRGILETQARFDIINLIRIPVGVFTFLGPVLVIWFWQARIDYIAIFLLLVRAASAVLYFIYAQNSLPAKQRRLQVDLRYVKSLLFNGGWMTVSNIISPIMGYVDRFLIGSMISGASVAFYATPQEIVTKLWIIPGALSAVLFPIFSSSVKNHKETNRLYRDSIQATFMIILPLCGFLILFEQEIMAYWISNDFARESRHILALLAIGILINSLAIIPFTLIQGAGKAKVTALVHLAELPFFVLAIWWLLIEFGVIGAAFAWVLRLIVDTALMLYLASKISGEKSIDQSSLFKYILVIFIALFSLIVEIDFLPKIIILSLSIFFMMYLLLLLRKKNRV